ncbi:MAG: ABC transporter permease [Thermoproteota archaeon]
MDAAQVRVERVSRLREFWRAYSRTRLGLAGLGILLFYVFMAVSAPWLAPYDPKEKVGEPFEPPSFEHPLGTDEMGRDILSQVIYGTRVSLLVGVLASMLAAAIGSSVGIVSGYFGGVVDDLLMRITDLFLVIPGLPFIIVLSVILGPSIWNIILVIAVISWPSVARLVRSETLSLKQRLFVQASRIAGASDLYIIFHHIFPNVLPIVAASMVLTVTSAIILEAGLSFLGLGDPTKISWGTMLYFADRYGALLSTNPFYVIAPGLALVGIGLAFVFVSYALDEVVNPRLRERQR